MKGGMISCLTVTQDGRYDSLTLAVKDFVRQTYTNTELVVVHDGGDDFHSSILALIANYPLQNIAIHRVKLGMVLGELRNLSVELANGDIICQWDDDDRYHSQRLELQYQHMVANKADFSFFMDQLHYFQPSQELFWDNWDYQGVAYKDSLVQGSIMGFKNKMPLYPALEKGEDTELTYQILEDGRTVAEFSDHGYLYIYQYTGNNTWGFEHHGLVASVKRYKHEKIKDNVHLVSKALSDFNIESSEISMPHDNGIFKLTNTKNVWNVSEEIF